MRNGGMLINGKYRRLREGASWPTLRNLHFSEGLEKNQIKFQAGYPVSQTGIELET
jgi:hypothetical protein